ncbi:MAG: TadE/TadG family type IV pilus assembly protein [Fuerstiella sp.]
MRKIFSLSYTPIGNKKKRRGAAMVEMAVCFPVFMLMLLGIIEFGRGLMVSQLLTSAAREGCRSAVMDGSTDTAVEAEITTQVVNTVGCVAEDINISIVVTSVSNGAVVPLLADADPRDLIDIDITVSFDSISFTAGRFLSGHLLRGQCAMRKE